MLEMCLMLVVLCLQNSFDVSKYICMHVSWKYNIYGSRLWIGEFLSWLYENNEFDFN